MKSIPYRNAIGSLLYCSTWTRPDIAYSVNSLSRFVENPAPAHWTALKRVIRYLKGTRDECLSFNSGSELELVGYCDSDWSGNTDSRRSQTGYIFFLAGGAITWKTKLQPTVALSTAEAEYMALGAAVQEAIYIRKILCDLNLKQAQPTLIFVDNQAAIHIAKNPVYHQRTKHIDIRHHYTREKIESKEVRLEYKPTAEMIADLLTKPVGVQVFKRLRSSILNVAQSKEEC
jgi:hypothetical protein